MAKRHNLFPCVPETLLRGFVFALKRLLPLFLLWLFALIARHAEVAHREAADQKLRQQHLGCLANADSERA